MPKESKHLNAHVEMSDDVWLVEIQYLTTYYKASVIYRSVGRFEDYGEEFHSYDDALDHLNYEVENDDRVHAARIKRKVVQTTELVVYDFDKEGV